MPIKNMPIKNRLAEIHAEITEWRHDIHAHPELMYDTHRTSGLVADKPRGVGSCIDPPEFGPLMPRFPHDFNVCSAYGERMACVWRAWVRFLVFFRCHADQNQRKKSVVNASHQGHAWSAALPIPSPARITLPTSSADLTTLSFNSRAIWVALAPRLKSR